MLRFPKMHQCVFVVGFSFGKTPLQLIAHAFMKSEDRAIIPATPLWQRARGGIKRRMCVCVCLSVSTVGKINELQCHFDNFCHPKTNTIQMLKNQRGGGLP